MVVANIARAIHWPMFRLHSFCLPTGVVRGSCRNAYLAATFPVASRLSSTQMRTAMMPFNVRTFSYTQPRMEMPERIKPAPQSGKSSSHEGGEGQTPPKEPRMGLYQRLKTMMKQYGWWAVGVYMIMSGIDCSLTFLAIHFYAGEQVGELEALLSKWLGPVIKKLKGGDEPKENAIVGYVKKWFVVEEKNSEFELLLARLSTEFVLAFAIHKTIMLPVRAGITLMITPPIVRWLVKRGWVRPVKQAVSKTAENKL